MMSLMGTGGNAALKRMHADMGGEMQNLLVSECLCLLGSS